MSNQNFRGNWQNIFFSLLLLLCGLLFFCIKAPIVNASLMDNYIKQDSAVVEIIRLRVSSEDRSAWLVAEEQSWEPWLEKKDGFIDRQLLWDQKQEEATLLIGWEDRSYGNSSENSEFESGRSRRKRGVSSDGNSLNNEN